MPYNYFILYVLIGALVIAWSLYQVNQQSNKTDSNDIETLNQNLDEMIDQRFKDTEKKQDQMLKLLINANSAQREQDFERMANPFIPPVQRGPYSPMLAMKTLPVNLPTHGEYGNFQQVGYAYKPNNPDQMFKLFGRRIHSNKYEYYVVHPYTEIKMPIKVKNDWEINNDEIITIPGFPGHFKVQIYDLDQPRYVPY
jgi:hypothetical protein